jgi:radical SAM superfamily enzyme YgiQ (UPF0313 family)
MKALSDILLTTINAKWIHPSLALRLLKANLGPLEERCQIIEFALRQPLREKVEPVLEARPRVLGISVSIWNHLATLELLRELEKTWNTEAVPRPIIVLGGPEVSYLPHEAEIFRHADFCVRGEGELAFRELCEYLLCGAAPYHERYAPQKMAQALRFLHAETVISGNLVNLYAKQTDVTEIKSAYHLYTDEDLRQKLTYVEASRGCPFTCEFCASGFEFSQKGFLPPVREFPLEPFLAEMDDLVRRGARTFKFLDRTFNLNIEQARRIMEFFLEKIEERETPLTVHFEMRPGNFGTGMLETLARFPPGSLRLEIGIQTLNPEIAERIKRPVNPEKELAALRLLREKTSAIMHVDLIAGLPGEDLASFGRGFDLLWAALADGEEKFSDTQTEIQLGILKLLPGAPIARHTEAFGMHYNAKPPYEVIATAALPERDMERIKNFARFWELIVNRRLYAVGSAPVFDRFMALADSLLVHFGRNWGIDKQALREYFVI